MLLLPNPTLPTQHSLNHAFFLPPKPISLPPLSPSRRLPQSLRCSTAESEPAAASSEERKAGSSIFGREKQLSLPQQALQSLPAPARHAASLVIVAGALALGYALGAKNVKGSRAAALGGALALGSAGGAAVYALNWAAPAIAAIHLRNAMVKHRDPKSLKPEEVDAIVSRFGVSKRDEALNAELRDIYDRFVTAVIPPGNEDLKGDEVNVIAVFKNALGLEDPDAAAVHIEIGRRIFRQRLETGDKEMAVQERRAFQKLVYVSNLVFGDASKFLLPWKRIFKVTDSQVEVAMRDNARRLFQVELNAIGRNVDNELLMELREAQHKYKLSDEIAYDMFRSHAQKQIEENLHVALEILRSRARIRNTGNIIKELDEVLSYNASLAAAAAHTDISALPPGIGPVSVIGGSFDNDRQMDELKQLYGLYLNEGLARGQLDADKETSLGQLKNVFALGNREAEEIMQEISVKIYRKRLAQAAVIGGDLDKAPSKAAHLQDLCDSLHLDPEKAKQVHEDIYRQKLQQCITDGELSDEDVMALQRLHILLCLSQEIVDAAHHDICGRLFEKVVDDAIAAGVDGYDADMKASLHKSVTGLRLSTEVAIAIASKAIRSVFITYIKRSRSAGSRVDSAQELKKMIIFNNLTVTELLADIKGKSQVSTSIKSEEPVKEEQETEEEDELQMLQTLRKTRPKRDIDAGRKPQTEITLKDDLDIREKTDLYRTYLLHCLSGETTGMPMGTQITVRSDTNEFPLLGQLGNILGLSSKDVAEVHKDLAEQAFKQQAQLILADGRLSKARMEQLNDLQKQLGLPSQSAQKVIRSITNTRMQGAIEAAINHGRLTIQQVRELNEAGVDIEAMISKEARQMLFKKIADAVLSSGTGDFNEEELFERIPHDLGLDVENSKLVVQDLAKERVTNSLVQAVALLRQKSSDGVVASLNNMIACDKAVPAQPLSWSVLEELADLFCLYYKSSASQERLSRVQYLLGIDNITASELKAVVDSGRFSFREEEEEFAF